jgi:predicted nucleotidyltransferase
VSTITPSQSVERLEALMGSGALPALLKRHRVELLVAFGSAVAPRSTRPPRDLDLAVAFEPEADGDLYRLTAELIGLLQLDELDVMDIDRAQPVARDAALSRCLLVYQARPGAYATRQMTAATQRMDTAWMRRLQLDVLAG